MPISISGSGTITGISAGGLPDGCIATDDLANNAVTAGKMGTTEQSRLCAAFVNFNGTGTVAIRASYNVSSITDNGVGQYTVNFTTALPDANYAVIGSAFSNITASAGPNTNTAPTTNACSVYTGNPTSLGDCSTACFAFFR
jgi:hypothetical protein